MATLPRRSENGLENLFGRTATIFPIGTRLRPPPALPGCGPDDPYRAALSPCYLQLAVHQRLRIGHCSAIGSSLHDGLRLQIDNDHPGQTSRADAWPQLD